MVPGTFFHAERENLKAKSGVQLRGMYIKFKIKLCQFNGFCGSVSTLASQNYMDINGASFAKLTVTVLLVLLMFLNPAVFKDLPQLTHDALTPDSCASSGDLLEPIEDAWLNPAGGREASSADIPIACITQLAAVSPPETPVSTPDGLQS